MPSCWAEPVLAKRFRAVMLDRDVTVQQAMNDSVENQTCITASRPSAGEPGSTRCTWPCRAGKPAPQGR
jgi:hypothetical protein